MSWITSRKPTPARDTAHTKIPLDVETLEHRILLAGNIRVLTNNAGDITIKGDGKSNHVEVSREITDQNGDGDTNDIVIRGTTDTTGQATGIKDGRDILSQVVIDADNGTLDTNVKVTLGGGNDFVIFRNVTIDSDFVFSPGGGSDSLGFFSSTVTGKSTLKTGGGNDYMNLVDATFEGPIEAKFGSGVDYLGLSNFALASGQLANINTGSGGDIFYIEDSTVAGDITLIMGSSIDTVYVAEGTTLTGNITVDTGSLFDFLVLENNVDVDNATLNVDGGRGGFGYGNLLFLYVDSPYITNRPDGISNFDADEYTISGNAYTGEYDMPTTLSKWVMDLYYSNQPPVNIDVIDTIVAANLARGFDFDDLPRSHLGGPAPDPAAIASEINFLINSPDYYLYQKIFVKAAFRSEISVFDWANFED